MKNLLGCEIQIFAVRPMWRSLIIRLAVAALGWAAEVAQALRYAVHKAPLRLVAI